MDHAFGILTKKSLPNPRSSRCSLMYPSRNFIALCFTFRSMTHFELIFVGGVRSVPGLIFLYVDVPLFHYHLLMRLSLLYCIAFSLSSKISWLYLCGSVFVLYFVHWYTCLFFSSLPHFFFYYSCFIVSQVVSILQLISLH